MERIWFLLYTVSIRFYVFYFLNIWLYSEIESVWIKSSKFRKRALFTNSTTFILEKFYAWLYSLFFPEYKTIWWNVYQLLNSNNEESEFFFYEEPLINQGSAMKSKC